MINVSMEHTGLSVSNLENSIAFYCDLLGFELVSSMECSPPEIRLGDVVGLPGCSARIAFLKLGDKIIELFEYLDPRGKSIPKDRTQADNGFLHLGFISTDIHSDYMRLTEKGVKSYNKPLEYRPGGWVFYFYGPDGETLELCYRQK